MFSQHVIDKDEGAQERLFKENKNPFLKHVTETIYSGGKKKGGKNELRIKSRKIKLKLKKKHKYRNDKIKK